jgi:hypothetical protein
MKMLGARIIVLVLVIAMALGFRVILRREFEKFCFLLDEDAFWVDKKRETLGDYWDLKVNFDEYSSNQAKLVISETDMWGLRANPHEKFPHEGEFDFYVSQNI